jgi:hypothetical protein
MWEPQPLTTLRAFKACRGENFTLPYLYHTYYNAIADLRNLEFNVTHAVGFSVSTGRLLATDLNTEISILNHYEVFLPFLFNHHGPLEFN